MGFSPYCPGGQYDHSVKSPAERIAGAGVITSCMPADLFADADNAAERGENSPLGEPLAALRRGDAITVSDLNHRVRNALEAKFELLWVAGELSNVMRAASGHWYFSLKDAVAQVRCVMFRQRAAAVGFNPENGMQVEVRALPSLYEPRGEFQLGVEAMRRAGLGALFEAFERLKARLVSEGLFSEDRKRALAAFPKVIGIVTSLKAAALRDVLTTLKRRAPMIEVVIYPASVQGALAAGEIAAAIDTARSRAKQDSIDALIICRGGGSVEDLWPFNEEIVARAVVRFQDDAGIAVVSGVGHETDFTICDFVADRRAPTPTAAAEMLSPDTTELLAQAAATRQTLARAMRRALDGAGQRLDGAARNLVSPAERVGRERDRLAQFSARACKAIANRLESSRSRVALLRQQSSAFVPDMMAMRANLATRAQFLRIAIARNLQRKRTQHDTAEQALQLLDPARVLERGYSIVTIHGAVLRDAIQANVGERIHLRLARGKLDAAVVESLAELKK